MGICKINGSNVSQDQANEMDKTLQDNGLSSGSLKYNESKGLYLSVSNRDAAVAFADKIKAAYPHNIGTALADCLLENYTRSIKPKPRPDAGIPDALPSGPPITPVITDPADAGVQDVADSASLDSSIDLDGGVFPDADTAVTKTTTKAATTTVEAAPPPPPPPPVKGTTTSTIISLMVDADPSLAWPKQTTVKVKLSTFGAHDTGSYTTTPTTGYTLSLSANIQGREVIGQINAGDTGIVNGNPQSEENPDGYVIRGFGSLPRAEGVSDLDLFVGLLDSTFLAATGGGAEKKRIHLARFFRHSADGLTNPEPISFSGRWESYIPQPPPSTMESLLPGIRGFAIDEKDPSKYSDKAKAAAAATAFILLLLSKNVRRLIRFVDNKTLSIGSRLASLGSRIARKAEPITSLPGRFINFVKSKWS